MLLLEGLLPVGGWVAQLRAMSTLGRGRLVPGLTSIGRTHVLSIEWPQPDPASQQRYEAKKQREGLLETAAQVMCSSQTPSGASP